jgi:hypothetical protein
MIFVVNFQSCQTFFILSNEYERILEEEKRVLVKHGGMTYNDANSMTTYQRKIQLELLMEEVERINAQRNAK